MSRASQTMESRSPVATCTGCGAQILWAVTADGTRLSLDQTPPTYLVRGDARRDGLPVVDRSRAYVSHFSTCTTANAFSGERHMPHQDAQEGTKGEGGDS